MNEIFEQHRFGATVRACRALRHDGFEDEIEGATREVLLTVIASFPQVASS